MLLGGGSDLLTPFFGKFWLEGAGSLWVTLPQHPHNFMLSLWFLGSTSL